MSSELTTSDGKSVSEKTTEYINQIANGENTLGEILDEIDTQGEEVSGAIMLEMHNQIKNIPDENLSDELIWLKYYVNISD